MPIEQEPIKIVIPVEEDAPEEYGAAGESSAPIMKPEQSSSNVTGALNQTGREFVDRARTAWESEQRRQAELVARAGARHGASVAKAGVRRGLNWLSARLAALAGRLE